MHVANCSIAIRTKNRNCIDEASDDFFCNYLNFSLTHDLYSRIIETFSRKLTVCCLQIRPFLGKFVTSFRVVALHVFQSSLTMRRVQEVTTFRRKLAPDCVGNIDT